MSAIAKPNNRAFVLDANKIDEFVKQKKTSDDILKRFYAHKPSKGVVTPLKENKGNVR